MPLSDSMKILLKHDQWATGNLIDACKNLSDEQLHQKFELGFGSLHNSIVHILGAKHGWADLLAQRDPRPRIDENERRTIGEIDNMHDEIASEFEELAMKYPAGELVSGERRGKKFTFTRGAVVTHVTTHGMHHRAQCLNMLRQLGIAPLPPSSVVEWTMMVDAKSNLG